MRFIIILLLIFAPLLSFAKQEVLQLVIFHWDEENKRLKLVSLGSGTVASKNTILTNKHVVVSGGKTADLILLCRGERKETSYVKCNTPAGVSTIHETLDVAIIKPLEETFLLGVKRSTTPRRYLETIRIVGYPTPEKKNNRTNFGDIRTKSYFEKWIKDGGELKNFKGDQQTITRGEIIAKVKEENSNTLYIKTNAIVNFGNSGGGVFDSTGSYVGIPTFKDSEKNSYFLEFSQIRDWFRNNAIKEPKFNQNAYNFYKEKSKYSLKKNTNHRWNKKRKNIFRGIRRVDKKNNSNLKNNILKRRSSKKYSLKYKSKKQNIFQKKNQTKPLTLRQRLQSLIKQKNTPKKYYKKQFYQKRKYSYK